VEEKEAQQLDQEALLDFLLDQEELLEFLLDEELLEFLKLEQ
jgi:hypothetical protein